MSPTPRSLPTRNYLIALALAVGVVAVLVVGNLTANRGSFFKTKDRTSDIQNRMTVRQHGHAKLHARFGRGKEKVLDEGISSTTHGMFVASPIPSTTPNGLDDISKIGCASDAVILGFVLDAVSLPIEDGTYLFTDYTIGVHTVFRLSKGSRLTPDSRITVSRPGGAVSIGPRTISTTDNMYPMLDKGARYLLFLKRDPTTGDYSTDRPDATYLLRGNSYLDLRATDLKSSEPEGLSRQTVQDRGLLRFGFRHFPQSGLHPDAFRAATAAECASQQGQFWPFHDRLFSHHRDQSFATLIADAKALDLNMIRYNRCLTGDGQISVRADIERAKSLGVSATPLFFIGTLTGETLHATSSIAGAQRFSVFEKQFEALTSGGASE